MKHFCFKNTWRCNADAIKGGHRRFLSTRMAVVFSFVTVGVLIQTPVLAMHRDALGRGSTVNELSIRVPRTTERSVSSDSLCYPRTPDSKSGSSHSLSTPKHSESPTCGLKKAVKYIESSAQHMNPYEAESQREVARLPAAYAEVIGWYQPAFVSGNEVVSGFLLAHSEIPRDESELMWAHTLIALYSQFKEVLVKRACLRGDSVEALRIGRVERLRLKSLFIKLFFTEVIIPFARREFGEQLCQSSAIWLYHGLASNPLGIACDFTDVDWKWIVRSFEGLIDPQGLPVTPQRLTAFAEHLKSILEASDIELEIVPERTIVDLPSLHYQIAHQNEGRFLAGVARNYVSISDPSNIAAEIWQGEVVTHQRALAAQGILGLHALKESFCVLRARTSGAQIEGDGLATPQLWRWGIKQLRRLDYFVRSVPLSDGELSSTDANFIVRLAELSVSLEDMVSFSLKMRGDMNLDFSQLNNVLFEDAFTRLPHHLESIVAQVFEANILLCRHDQIDPGFISELRKYARRMSAVYEKLGHDACTKNNERIREFGQVLSFLAEEPETDLATVVFELKSRGLYQELGYVFAYLLNQKVAIIVDKLLGPTASTACAMQDFGGASELAKQADEKSLRCSQQWQGAKKRLIAQRQAETRITPASSSTCSIL